MKCLELDLRDTLGKRALSVGHIGLQILHETTTRITIVPHSGGTTTQSNSYFRTHPLGGGDMAEGQSEQSERPKENLATSSMPGGGLRLRKTQSCAPSSAPDSPAWLPTQYRTPFLLLPPRPPPSLLSPATPPPTIDQALPPPPHPACLAKSTKTPQSGNRVQLFKCCSAMLRYFPISSLCTLTPTDPVRPLQTSLSEPMNIFENNFLGSISGC